MKSVARCGGLGATPNTPRVCTTQVGKGSRLVGKVYNLCRVLETGISAKLTVKSSLGILFD